MSQTVGSRLPGPRRWKALVFISLAQLMVVLDSTVVNIALPNAQHDLGISDADRQWAITAYALAFAALGAYFMIREPEGGRNRSPLDIPGVVLSALGLVSPVYGVTRDASSGWSAPSTIGMFGVFLFLTYYLQVVEGYSAIRTGLAYLPIAISFIVGATQIGTRLATRLPARMFMVPGFAVAVLGMLLLTRLAVGSSYPGVILPGLILLGLGMGTALMPVISPSTHGIQARDAGVAAAMANTSQQLGGAIGTALLNTIAERSLSC